MKKLYKTLTNDEFKVLSKISRKTGSDCWFILKQDCHGVYYVYDLEERRRMCLKTGVSMLAESIDCQENFDNCCLDYNEIIVLRDLCCKLDITKINWHFVENSI